MATKRLIRQILAVLCFCLFASSEVAYSQRAYAVGDVPNVHLQDARLYTSDPEGLLSSQERQSIDSLARRIELERGVQTALVVLPSIGERDVEGFANDLFRQWGIGDQEEDKGLLILYVGDQRRVRCEVGYGLEGVLTDALMGRVQRESMIPWFKQGRVGAGLFAGLLSIERQLASEGFEASSGDSSSAPDSVPWSTILVFWALFASVVLYFAYTPLRARLQKVSTPSQARVELPRLEGDAGTLLSLTGLICLPLLPFVYLWWRGRKRSLRTLSASCPVCGGVHMHPRRVDGETLHLLSPAQLAEARLGSRMYYVYECSDCGATELAFAPGVRSSHYTICPICKAQAVDSERVGRVSPRLVRYRRRCHCCGWSEDQDKRERDQDSDLATALILGSLLRGGGRGGFSSGGGFSGGSWGGGSSGGGGATSGW